MSAIVYAVALPTTQHSRTAMPAKSKSNKGKANVADSMDKFRPAKFRQVGLPTDGRGKPLQKRADILKQVGLFREGEEGELLRVQFSATAVKNQLHLPEVRKGETYAPTPLVRSNVASREFERKFKESGFQPDMAILVVPQLTQKEQEAWPKKKDRVMEAVRSDILNNDSKRVCVIAPRACVITCAALQEYWVCDGATRRGLCVKYDMDLYANFLMPDVSYMTAFHLAVGTNDSSHAYNETG